MGQEVLNRSKVSIYRPTSIAYITCISHKIHIFVYFFVITIKVIASVLTLQVLPVGVFISTIISVLYYIGVMQMVIRKLAWFLYVAMGTTAGESLNATANIFLGLASTSIVFI